VCLLTADGKSLRKPAGERAAGATKVFRDCSTQTYLQAAWALLFFVVVFKHIFAVQKLKKRIAELESRPSEAS
jgi:hypothetical protein